ncbi:GNAT superfamily N-acetyltransferase [Chryseobacterium defluvii]|uniref:GNAT superfamily N-acetyltransferase n=1 Tax=Chryseobacterium defluvii TaxID=160396 RepID=A0A840KLE0_9FLAO|nr:GNAT family N-acetyltransferase [Chryseobacterium defluvii]MBB4808310.1 GNAT superfamily N-acetyltransferase [Chryseobacterium defluvii]
MKILEQNKLTEIQKKNLWDLWNNEYPVQLNYEKLEDFNKYIKSLENSFNILLLDDGKIIGWAFSFDREGERWFGIIVSENYQNKRYGSLMLKKLKEHESQLNGWVIDKTNYYYKKNDKPYKSPIDFYLKNEFKIINDSILETPKFSAIKITWSKLIF